jgi:hypothetical protein
VNLTTAAVGNESDGSDSKYQVPRSAPRSLRDPDTCCNCDS